ncbi:MAG: glycoside hydrolase domain-containing protein [Pirellulaceae bacterium]
MGTFIRQSMHLAGILAAAVVPASAQDIPYGVGDWPESLGNHRARIRVEQRADAVWVHLPWRRRDATPDGIDIVVIDATTSTRVENVLRVNIQRPFGDLLFQPATVPGEYDVYYLPCKTEGPWYFPTTVYTPPSPTAESAWVEACQPLIERLRAGNTAGLSAAQVIEFQAINAFHRFDPMEVVASAEEVASLQAAHPDRPYLLFPEDRRYPIRMTDELPLCWVRRGPSECVSGEACCGEFFTWQVGLWACDQPLDNVTVTLSDLTPTAGTAGAAIPATALRCFNLGGTDWLGRPLHKIVSVPHGNVQALWFGAAIPRDAAAGTYRGTVTIGARNAAPTAVALTLRISDQVLDDAGDAELWRHARLRWLDSTIGLDDDVFPPYTPVTETGLELAVLGRTVRLADTGLFESIASSFSRNVDGIDSTPQEILAEPMRVTVALEGGQPVTWQGGSVTITDRAPGGVSWEATSTAGTLELTCRAKLECDGYTNFRLTLKAHRAARLHDIRLEIPMRRDVATYMMGLGRKGGYRPSRWQWNWDIARSNNQFWIGDVHAGLSCKLKHTDDRWDLFNLQEFGLYQDWSNDGQGGCVVEELGADQVVVRAYTGPRDVTAGQELHFHFGLLITPVKMLDQNHWQWRYFHRSAAAPVSEVAATGATIINLHQGDGLNPYINYPFLTTEELATYATAAHAQQMKVKLYYTVRELSNYAAEFWALRSLHGEIYTTGSGFRLADQFADQPTADRGPTGSAWLCEHAVTGYVPAWHQPLGNGHCDAAIATTGLSRWHNYYLEGLNWLVRNVGVDGLYLDGIGYDREIMKRVRKVLQRARPGCLIDFHSGNHFHPQYGLNNCANLYIELFPCIDSLWFGEGFDYNEPPDYWMVEIAGIPYGLFGEMLQGGGNPWRGMIYGMTSRLGWGGDPRGLWKVWDDFGIDQARMIGYWDATCPVQTGRDDVLATVYQRDGKTLVALASWAPEPVTMPLTIDFSRLGLDPAKAHLYAPRIPGLQGEVLFAPDAAIPVAPARGWLLVLDEQVRDVAPALDLCAGRTLLCEDPLAGDRLDPQWIATLSSQPDTTLRISGGELLIEAAANVAAYIERTIPSGARLVVCRVDQRTDAGASWGPGLTLVWPDGKVLRVNLRAEGRFGVDDGQRQILEGVNLPQTWTQMAVQLNDTEIVIQAAQELQAWQELARFPRHEFAGDPIAVRLGKMSPGSKNEDFSTRGPVGACAIKEFRVLGE